MTDAPSPSRYHRQQILPQIGEDGQRAIGRAHTVIVGCGALGTAAAELLARAGVGRLTIIDRDIVEETNLQRQTLFTEADAREGLPKAEAARRRLGAINSGITIDAVIDDLSPRNAEALIGAPGVMLDCTDNFETRYLLNDLAAKHGTPLIYAGAVGTAGMLMSIVPRPNDSATPCLRCVFDEMPAPGSSPTCDTAGVLGPVTALFGAMQAAEAIKVLVGDLSSIQRRLVHIDLWSGDLRTIDTGAPRGECPCCARRDFAHLRGDHAAPAITLCGRGAVQVVPESKQGAGIDLGRLAQRLAPHGTFTSTPFALRGTLTSEASSDGSPCEITVFPNARAIIRGTDEPGRARSIYAKYIGA